MCVYVISDRYKMCENNKSFQSIAEHENEVL